jgi:tetratricopeptide (TPR) repeat protein
LTRITINIVRILTFFVFMSAVQLLAEDGELPPARGIEHYKKLVQKYPQEAPYWNALGYYYLKSGDLQEAKTNFAKAIELDGTYPIPHNNLGVVYLKQKSPEEAEREFRQAVRLNPQYCKAQYNLAVALFHQKRYKDAGKAYLKARDLDSEYVERRNGRENLEKKIEKVLDEKARENDQSTQELKRMRQWFAPYY